MVTCWLKSILVSDRGVPCPHLFFNLVVDWIIRQTTEDQLRGIRWTALSCSEDLDYADDVALPSHTHLHIQEKTRRLNTFAKQVGLNISSK